MLASKQFGCKEFFQNLILVVLCPLYSFVTIKVLLIYPQIQLPGRGPSMQRSTCTILGRQCMTEPSFCNTTGLMSRLQTYSPRDFQKRSSLTSVHCKGDPANFSVQLEGGGSHWVFPPFLTQFVFENCLSFSIVQGDLWPLLSWPQYSYALYVFYFF